jgi:glycogenin glucosyltransferase
MAQAVYDYVIPVVRIRNERPANLYLMNRPDLHSAFTKINLWRQTQFRKIVYLDADVVAYRAPDELFDLPHAFSAAPDIGWPDLFNTGVMVLTPNMGDYYAMMAMADRGISFDGADQGLLNMHFKNTYNRLSFTYNVTPSAHYQYVPAYKHFQSSINLVHFIGSEKPWLQGRDKSKGDSPFDEIAGRWWAVYDRHYRVYASEPVAAQITTATAPTPAPELVQYFVKGEYQPPRTRYVVPVGSSSISESKPYHGQLHQPLQAPSHAEYQAQHHEQPRFDSTQPERQHQHQPRRDFQPRPAHPQHQGHHEHHHSQSHDQHHAHHRPEQDHAQHHDQYHEQPHYQGHSQRYDQPEPHHSHEQPQPRSFGQQPEHPPSLPSVSFSSSEGTHTEARAEQALEHQHGALEPTPPEPESKPEPYQPPPVPSWDAQRSETLQTLSKLS